jgi:hypothetical protein
MLCILIRNKILQAFTWTPSTDTVVFTFRHIFDSIISSYILVGYVPALDRVICTLGDWYSDMIVRANCSAIEDIKFATDVHHLQSDNYVDIVPG